LLEESTIRLLLLTGLVWSAVSVTSITVLAGGDIVLSFVRKRKSACKKSSDQSDGELHNAVLRSKVVGFVFGRRSGIYEMVLLGLVSPGDAGYNYHRGVDNATSVPIFQQLRSRHNAE